VTVTREQVEKQAADVRQAKKRMAEIRADPAYFDSLNPKNELLVSEMEEMQRVALAAPIVADEVVAKRTAAAKARKQLAEIRANPAFFDSSADPAKHLELQQKFDELAPVAYADEE
jgi:uncharacterized membrane protein YjjP (DUF1212 family)